MATRLAVLALIISTVGAPQTPLPTTLPKFCNAKTPAAIQAMVNHELSCGFERSKMSFAGTPVQQARCLLRRAAPGGGLPPNVPLPEPLEHLIGTKVDISSASFAAYLSTRGVSPSEIGGPLAGAVAKTAEGHPATYFVIHDTSTPNYLTKAFGPEIDAATWYFNDKLKERWMKGEDTVAHLFIGRTGKSITALDYSTPWRATRTESCVLLTPSKGLFLHNELVQPRRSDPHRDAGNDGLAPSAPFNAFPAAQLDRLALAYVAASVRAGRWLIPAFHASIDETMPGGHDDPRDFDLADWAERVGKIDNDLSAGH